MSEAIHGPQFELVMTDLEAGRRWDLMLRLARERLANRPDCAAAHHWTGLAALRLGDLNTAAYHAEQLRAREPDEPNTFHLWASLYQKRGQWQEAGDCLEEALSRWPEVEAFHQMLAATHIKRNDEFAARAAAIETLRLNPGNLPARLAVILLKHHYSYRVPLIEQQIDELKTLLADEPNHPVVLAQVGQVYLHKLGSPTQAIPFLEQALAADPHRRCAQEMLELARQLAADPSVTDVVGSSATVGSGELTCVEDAAPAWQAESPAPIIAAVASGSDADTLSTFVDANSRLWTGEAVEELWIS